MNMIGPRSSNSADYSFWQNVRTWQTDIAWRHRPRLHSIARQKRWPLLNVFSV